MHNSLTSRNECEFCNEFACGTENSFAARYAHELGSRTILEEGNFRVLPSLGQVVPGYLLLVPKHHHRAFADMSSEELNVAEDLKTHLVGRLRSTYGDYLFFEHGVRTSDSGGCGISHAHLHAVPFPYEKDPIEKLTREFAFEKVSTLIDLMYVRPERSYLYYEAVGGDKYVLYPQFIPSQYIRRLLAEALGIQGWDWRQCGTEEKLLTTLSRTRTVLAGVPR